MGHFTTHHDLFTHKGFFRIRDKSNKDTHNANTDKKATELRHILSYCSFFFKEATVSVGDDDLFLGSGSEMKVENCDAYFVRAWQFSVSFTADAIIVFRADF